MSEEKPQTALEKKLTRKLESVVFENLEVKQRLRALYRINQSLESRSDPKQIAGEYLPEATLPAKTSPKEDRLSFLKSLVYSLDEDKQVCLLCLDNLPGSVEEFEKHLEMNHNVRPRKFVQSP